MGWFTRKTETNAPAPASAPAPMTDADRRRRRRELAAQWRETESRLATEVTAAGSAIASLRSKAAAINEQLLACGRELNDARARAGAAQGAYDRARDEFEAAALELADPQIDAFIAELDTALGQVMNHVSRGTAYRKNEHGDRIAVPTSNLDAVQLVSQALLRARDRAVALKVAALDDVSGALEDLRQAIPSVAEAEEQIQKTGPAAAPATA